MIRPGSGLRAPGGIQDAGPNSWGQRIILARHFGHRDRDSDTGDLSLLTYLLESGSDRIGALDFQARATDYIPRLSDASLAQMQESADSAVRWPNSLRDWRKRCCAAPQSVVRVRRSSSRLVVCNLNVAPAEVTSSLGRDVLSVERFDRTPIDGERRLLVSALAMLGLDEMMGRYATYYDLADLMRRRFDNARRPCEGSAKVVSRYAVTQARCIC